MTQLNKEDNGVVAVGGPAGYLVVLRHDRTGGCTPYSVKVFLGAERLEQWRWTAWFGMLREAAIHAARFARRHKRLGDAVEVVFEGFSGLRRRRVEAVYRRELSRLCKEVA